MWPKRRCVRDGVWREESPDSSAMAIVDPAAGGPRPTAEGGAAAAAVERAGARCGAQRRYSQPERCAESDASRAGCGERPGPQNRAGGKRLFAAPASARGLSLYRPTWFAQPGQRFGKVVASPPCAGGPCQRHTGRQPVYRRRRGPCGAPRGSGWGSRRPAMHPSASAI